MPTTLAASTALATTLLKGAADCAGLVAAIQAAAPPSSHPTLAATLTTKGGKPAAVFISAGPRCDDLAGELARGPAGWTVVEPSDNGDNGDTAEFILGHLLDYAQEAISPCFEHASARLPACPACPFYPKEA